MRVRERLVSIKFLRRMKKNPRLMKEIGVSGTMKVKAKDKEDTK